MLSIRRNQVIITALVVMIAVAGYLNYVDGNANQEPGGRTDIVLDDNGEMSVLIPSDNSENYDDYYGYESELGEISDALLFDDTSIYMSDDEYASEGLDDPFNDPGEAVFVSSNDMSSFFVEAKLDREQTRSKQKDILMGMINDTQLTQDQRGVCAEAMLEIQKRIEKESATESLIEAKGFKDAYVRIDDDTVDVIINKEVLTDAEIAQIEDIVKRKTGMAADKIRISTMKK